VSIVLTPDGEGKGVQHSPTLSSPVAWWLAGPWNLSTFHLSWPMESIHSWQRGSSGSYTHVPTTPGVCASGGPGHLLVMVLASGMARSPCSWVLAVTNSLVHSTPARWEQKAK
jgi:hypothetical protein